MNHRVRTKGSLASRVVLSLVSLITVVLAGAGWLAQRSYREDQLHKLQQRHALLADQLAIGLPAPLRRGDRPTLARFADGSFRHPAVFGVEVSRSGDRSAFYRRTRGPRWMAAHGGQSGMLVLAVSSNPAGAPGLEVPDLHGELADLLGSLVSMVARLQQLNATLEQRVAERTAQLALSNQELQTFSYSVSHDLRAPLRGIDAWSQAVLDDCGAQLDAQGHEHLARVRAETERMNRLIDDMLRLAKVTQSEMSLELVDVSALAHAIVGRLQEQSPQREVECAIEHDLMVRGDARLLQGALGNLLDNAWKFTGKRERARIEVGRTSKDGARVLFVRDNGAGFDMAGASKLFAPFQRMHRAAEFPGTGIGLATVQRIVHRHGGQIWVESEVDRGTTFFLTLEAST